MRFWLGLAYHKHLARRFRVTLGCRLFGCHAAWIQVLRPPHSRVNVLVAIGIELNSGAAFDTIRTQNSHTQAEGFLEIAVIYILRTEQQKQLSLPRNKSTDCRLQARGDRRSIAYAVSEQPLQICQAPQWISTTQVQSPCPSHDKRRLVGQLGTISTSERG